MEDDDLFWRCYKEGYTNDTFLSTLNNQKYLHFDGTAKVEIPLNKNIRNIPHRSHTISMLCRAYNQPEKQNIYEAMKAGKKVDKLPLTLGEAIDRLDSDEIIKSALPDEMLRVFMHYKKDEWEKFLSAVTQWDVDTYLDILP